MKLEHLDMLTRREQLMEDINAIVESQCGKGSEELVALPVSYTHLTLPTTPYV